MLTDTHRINAYLNDTRDFFIRFCSTEETEVVLLSIGDKAILFRLILPPRVSSSVYSEMELFTLPVMAAKKINSYVHVISVTRKALRFMLTEWCRS